MNCKSLPVFVMLLLIITNAFSQKNKPLLVASPDGKVKVTVEAAQRITWSVKHESTVVIAPSAVFLTLGTGEVLGENPKIISSKIESGNTIFNTTVYKKSKVSDNYNQLTIKCKGDYGVVIRAYNDGAAYRFFTAKKQKLIIRSEGAEFNFDKDHTAFIPYTSDLRGGERYTCSFEEFYTAAPISKFNKDTLGYLPLLVQLDDNKKAVLLEADVQDYPGMFVQLNQQLQYGIKATFAPYPLEETLGGYNRINYMVTKRADYIAKVSGTRNFPWRVIVVSEQDKELLNNDMVQKLSEPNKIENTSWIKPCLLYTSPSPRD